MSRMRFSTDLILFSSAALTPSLFILRRTDSSCSRIRSSRPRVSSASAAARSAFSVQCSNSCFALRTCSRPFAHAFSAVSTAFASSRTRSSAASASRTRRSAASRFFSAAASSSRFARMRRFCSSWRCLDPRSRGFTAASGCSRPRNATIFVSTSSFICNPPRAASAALSASTASGSDSAASTNRATQSVSAGEEKSPVRT